MKQSSKPSNQSPEAPKTRNVSKFTIMKHIEAIVEFTKESKLSEEAIKKCEPHSKLLAEKLAISETQALLLSIFVEQSSDESIRIRDIARHFDCRNISIMCYSDDIERLAQIGYLRRRKPTRYQRFSSYRVPYEVLCALQKNSPYTAPSIAGLTNRKFFEHLYNLFEAVEDDNLSIEDLSANIVELVEQNPSLQICKAIGLYNLSDEDEYGVTLALFFCHKLINENDDRITFHDLERIFDSKVDFNSVRSAFKGNSHDLLSCCVVESKKDSELASTDCYCLTDKAKDEFLSELNIELNNQKRPKDIICHAEIGVKHLFYNASEQQQIEQLTTLLGKDNFASMQNRLVESGMRKGFACLFYGSPGTGKTETVYQIARQTGRDILAVNVSEIKSMWVGESEKNIKALFDRYRNLSKSSAATPILLFNEADAVLGLRQEGAERAVDKMENSIQNIILQEMEFLDGIMIATTNLTKNLDKAFERRFLYKIEFSKPSDKAKQAIWQSMMPVLSDSEASQLACTYNFSGGQIENIARKSTVETIIGGVEPSLETIHSYCQCELLHKTLERRPIGY